MKSQRFMALLNAQCNRAFTAQNVRRYPCCNLQTLQPFHRISWLERRRANPYQLDFGTRCQSNDAKARDQDAKSNPFKATDKNSQKAEAISSGPADTRHFMEVSPSHRPLESALSETPAHKSKQSLEDAMHTLPHPIWTADAVHSVKITHLHPDTVTDKLAFASVKTMRAVFDVLSGYALGRIDERGWLNRIVFLETVAGVPGMIGAMVRHLTSLRKMERDYGWIHTLLEEAENERMHLMTALVLKRPSALFRAGVLLTQGAFLSAFLVSYLLSPHFAHRFVGYLEEEAVITYTKLLVEIDAGHLPLFEALPAPTLARDYWALGEGSNFRDVILAIRADESHHREVNHTFAGMQKHEPNPFPPGH